MVTLIWDSESVALGKPYSGNVSMLVLLIYIAICLLSIYLVPFVFQF